MASVRMGTENGLKLWADRADQSGMKHQLDSLVWDERSWVAALLDLLDAIELEWAMENELGIAPPLVDQGELKPFELL